MVDARSGPLVRDGLTRRLGPFAAAPATAVVTSVLWPTNPWRAGLVAAIALSGVLLAAIVLVPWERLPRWTQAGPPLACVPLIALLQHAEGGVPTAYTALVVVPVLWLALHGTRGELAVAVVAVAAVVWIPPLGIGAPDYPWGEWRRAVVWTGVAPLIGFTVQSLVASLRRHDETLQAIVDAAHELSRHPDARQAVCETAQRMAGASVVHLLEPDGHGHLTVTARVGTESRALRFALGREPSGAGVAFASGQRFFVPDAPEHPAVSPRLVNATGVMSVLFEPVLRAGDVTGVLMIGWDRRLPAPPRGLAAALTLLAAEAAVSIERADLVARLEAVARTDELTGLHNRRAWEEELPRELGRAQRHGRPLSLALLDLDHFKAFNDRHGHQAGDAFLRATAASWRPELRDGDLLARYGGEEFGVLLPDCPLDRAAAVVDRLRGLTPAGQTCSAGVVQWNHGEDAATLLARADRALYAAKHAGRDRLALGRWPEEDLLGAPLPEQADGSRASSRSG